MWTRLEQKVGETPSGSLDKSDWARLEHRVGDLSKILKGYRPSDDEPFTSERQRDYFRRKVLAWREEILRSTKETLQHLRDESAQHADIADRASTETERALELRARDRHRKLIAKIDVALARLDEGTYGIAKEEAETQVERWSRTKRSGTSTRSRPS